MNAWKVVCATLVIFLAGIVTGAVLVRFAERGPKPWVRTQRELAHRPGRPPTPNSGAPNPGPLSREFVRGLERQLQLTPEQREQVNKIMGEGQERIRALRQGIEPEIRKEMQKTHEQIQALLTAEQREQFQRLLKQHLQRRNDSPAPPERRFREPREQRGPPEFREPVPPSDDARNTGPQTP